MALGVPVTSLASACDLLVQVTEGLCGKVRSSQKAQEEERDTRACGYKGVTCVSGGEGP